MYRYIFIVLSLFSAAISSKAQLVLNGNDGLPDLGRGSVAWADLNNDGLLDVAITGINGLGTKEIGVYFNNGDGTFANSGAGLTAVSDGDIVANDLNQDGFIDLLITGLDGNNNKVTKLYKNTSSGMFTALPISLEGVAHGGAAFADFNNDGKPDVLLNGLNDQNQSITKLFLNNGDETFTQKVTTLQGTSYGDLLVFDFNNDSFLDVLISGLNNNNQRVMDLYENQGHGVFVKKETTLPAMRSGGMASADFNNDGYADLFISGSVSGTTNRAEVYRNNAGAGFVLQKTLDAVVDGGGAWGDYDHDGFADLALFGFDNAALKAILFKNVNGSDLVNSGISLPGTSKGSCSWMDYTNDNKLDFFLGGYSTVPFSSLYTNTASGTNTLPSAPSNLAYTAFADSIVLSWDAATDQETASEGLTYSVYIGTSPGATNVKTSLANITTGLRKVAGMGEVQHTSLVIQGLPEGVYYWSVQAIDPSFGASPFSPESTFISCAPISIAGSNRMCLHSEISLDAGQPEDQVQWFTLSNNNLIGSGNHLDFKVSAHDTIVASVTRPIGCTVTDQLVVDILPVPAVNAGGDQMKCLKDQVIVNAITAASVVSWVEEGSEDVLATSQSFSFNITNEVALVVKVEDSNGCVNTDTLMIGLYSQPVIHLGDDRVVCIGTAIGLSAGAGLDSVNWFSKKRGMLLQDDFNITIQINEADEIRAEIFNEQGCVSYDTIDVNVMPLPLAEAGEDKMICEDDAVNIGIPLPDQAGLTFQWEPAASLTNSAISNPVASPGEDTKYFLLVRDENNCERRDSVWVYLNAPSTINIGNDTTICQGDKVRLGGKPTASGSMLPYAYTWSPATGLDNATSANPIASPAETTIYSLQTTAGECVLDVSQITLTVHSLPEVRANEDLVVGIEESTTLSVEGALSYQWFPAELFTENTSANPIIFPNRTTNYVVKGRDANGCYGTDTVKVTVRSEVFVPSLFTPNDDGLNDVFRVHGFGIKQITFKVFDRWGRLLFESDNLEIGWDGRMNGNEVEPGTFVWTIEGFYFDGTPLEYKGQQRGVVKLLR